MRREREQTEEISGAVVAVTSLVQHDRIIPQSENLNNPSIRFEMDPDKAKWTESALAVIGLPTRNISFICYEENTTENVNWLGSVNYADGSMRLYSRLGEEGSGAEQAASTLYHESIHEATCFNSKNDAFYGSREAREEAKNYFRNVAEQSVITGIPLNGYHAELMKKLNMKEEEGGISIGRFYRETEAIMSQMRVFNYEQLQKIQQKQYAVLTHAKTVKTDQRVEGLEFTRLTGIDRDRDLVGVDRTLAILHRVKSGVELGDKFAEIKKFAANSPSPFSSRQS